MRYVVRWDDVREGLGIFDLRLNTWVEGQPIFALEDLAWSVAEALEARDRSRSLRHIRRADDRRYDRK
jgi:hypothetical protein